MYLLELVAAEVGARRDELGPLHGAVAVQVHGVGGLISSSFSCSYHICIFVSFCCLFSYFYLCLKVSKQDTYIYIYIYIHMIYCH